MEITTYIAILFNKMLNIRAVRTLMDNYMVANINVMIYLSKSFLIIIFLYLFDRTDIFY
jgi:hypothetical protein